MTENNRPTGGGGVRGEQGKVGLRPPLPHTPSEKTGKSDLVDQVLEQYLACLVCGHFPSECRGNHGFAGS